MSTVPTLHSICFDYIKDHTEELVSLDGIPYEPTVKNIINYLFTSPVPLNKSILSVVSTSHSNQLRESQSAWTRIVFHSLTCSVFPRLMVLSLNFPKFVTHLKLGATDVCDNDMYLFANFTNLIVLDLSKSNITDRSVSYITTMALNTAKGRGFPYLKEIYLDHVKGITDKSLKFFGKLNLSKISLTGTSVTPKVATIFLSAYALELSANAIPPYFTERLSKVNFKFYQFIEECSWEHPIPSDRKMPNHFSSEQTTHDVPLYFSRVMTAREFVINRCLKGIKKSMKEAKEAKEGGPLYKKRKTDEFLSKFVKEIANDKSD